MPSPNQSQTLVKIIPGSNFHAIVELDKELDGEGHFDVSASVSLLPKHLGVDDVDVAPFEDAEGIFYLLAPNKEGVPVVVGTQVPWYRGNTDSGKDFYVSETSKVTGWDNSDIQSVMSNVDNLVYSSSNL